MTVKVLKRGASAYYHQEVTLATVAVSGGVADLISGLLSAATGIQNTATTAVDGTASGGVSDASSLVWGRNTTNAITAAFYNDSNTATAFALCLQGAGTSTKLLEASTGTFGSTQTLVMRLTGGGMIIGQTLQKGAGTLNALNGLYDGGTRVALSTDVIAIAQGGTGAITAPLALVALGAVPLAGGTMTGILTLSANPTNANEAATKTYVDGLVSGLSIRTAVRAATTANITLSGTQTVDGVALIAADRCMVKNQSTASQNGIYDVAAGAWTRSLDSDTWAELVNAFAFVTAGTVNGSTGWDCNVLAGGTIGTTAVTFAQFTGVGVQITQPNIWSGVQTYGDGKLQINGLTSGTMVLKAPATGGGTITFPAGTLTLPALNVAQLWTAVQTMGAGNFKLNGASSGSTTINAVAAASGTITVPSVTDTLMVLGTAQTVTGALQFNSGTAKMRPGALTFDGSSSGNITVQAAAGAGSGTLTIPTLGANDTFALLGVANSFSGANTFTAAGGCKMRPGALTFDGSSSGNITLQATAAAGSGTISFPNISTNDIVSLLGVAQTYSAAKVFSSTLNVTGTFQMSGNTMTSPGSAQTLVGLTATQTLTAKTLTAPIITTTTVAALPAGTTGMIAFATNLRVFNGAGVQEGAGVGTGGHVSYNGSAWKITGTNITAVA